MAQVKRHRSPQKDASTTSTPTIHHQQRSPSKSSFATPKAVSIPSSSKSTSLSRGSTATTSTTASNLASSHSNSNNHHSSSSSSSTTLTTNLQHNKPSPFKQMLNMKKSHIYNLEHRKKPDELRRKDLISAMKLPDHENLNRKDYLKILDPWRQDWERGVQVPVDATALPKVNLRQFNQDSPSNKRTVSCDVSIRQTKFPETFQRPEERIDYEASSDVIIGKYELDLQDISWLSAVRDSELNVYITDTLMEDVINELEQECARNMKDENIGIEFVDDTVCDVCQNGEVEDGNEIVFCEQCNIGVHQACYGVESIPEEDWLCNVCRSIKPDMKKKKPTCVLCPKPGGAMKPTTRKHKWAHVSCAYWIPEVQFVDYNKLEPIDYKNIQSGRWNRDCALCNIPKGATICCDVKKCFSSFHVTCAFKHHLKMKLVSQPDGNVSFHSFCSKHSEDKSDNAGVEIHNQQSTSSSTPRKHSSNTGSSSNTRKTSSKKNSEFWKHVDIKKLIDNITKQYDTDSDLLQGSDSESNSGTQLEYDEGALKQVIEMIYQYWKLKRICNYGNSLIKLTLAQKFEEHMNSTYHRMKSFRFHMERLRTVGYMIYKRDQAKERYFKAQKEVFENICKAFLMKDSLTPISAVVENGGEDHKDKEKDNKKEGPTSAPMEWKDDMYIEDQKLCNAIMPHQSIYDDKPTDKKKELNTTKYLLRQLKKLAESDRIYLSTIKNSFDNPYARTYRHSGLQRTNSELKLLAEASSSKKRSKTPRDQGFEGGQEESSVQPKKRLKLEESPQKKQIVKKNLAMDFDKVVDDLKEENKPRTYNFRRSPPQDDQQHSNDSDSHQKENNASKRSSSASVTTAGANNNNNTKLVKNNTNNNNISNNTDNDNHYRHHNHHNHNNNSPSKTKPKRNGKVHHKHSIDMLGDEQLEIGDVLKSNNSLDKIRGGIRTLRDRFAMAFKRS